MRESSFEGRPATLKLAQCVFSESTLFWKILVTRVKQIQQGAANKAIRDCCETGISVCGWKPVSERTQFHRRLFAACSTSEANVRPYSSACCFAPLDY